MDARLVAGYCGMCMLACLSCYVVKRVREDGRGNRRGVGRWALRMGGWGWEKDFIVLLFYFIDTSCTGRRIVHKYNTVSELRGVTATAARIALVLRVYIVLRTRGRSFVRWADTRTDGLSVYFAISSLLNHTQIPCFQ